MKPLARVCAVILLGLAGLAAAQSPMHMPNPLDPGMSPQSAIRVVANNEIMVDHFIRRWLQSHYPNWDAEPHQYTEIGPEKYAVVYITAPNQQGRKIYFRVQQHPMDDGESPWPSR